MKQYEEKKEVVTIGKKEYQALLTMYYKSENEYTKFFIDKIFPEEDLKKAAAKLVNKGFALYSDNTNKIQISLNGFNAITHPPGLTVDEQNSVCYLFSPPSKLVSNKSAINVDSKRTTTRSTGSTRVAGVSKKDIVAKYLDNGQDPQQIFESMAKDGIQTTVGSVRCFIKTINTERQALKPSKPEVKKTDKKNPPISATNGRIDLGLKPKKK